MRLAHRLESLRQCERITVVATRSHLVAARDAIDTAIKQADIDLASVEVEYSEKSLAQVIEANAATLGKEWVAELKDAAEAFDTSYELGDTDGMNDFGMDVLEVVEKGIDESEDNAIRSAFQKVAAAVASMAPEDEEEDEEQEADDDMPVDEEDVEKKPRTLGKRPTKSDPIVMEKKEFDILRGGLLGFGQK